MLEIDQYAFSFGLCFSRQIMLKIMLAYCINASEAGVSVTEDRKSRDEPSDGGLTNHLFASQNDSGKHFHSGQRLAYS